MPCLLYEPTQGLTTIGAQLFADCLQRELCFKMGAPKFELEQRKTEEKTMSGRPCITKDGEDCLVVTLNAIQQHVKDKPQWIEFIRSTGCGEEVTVNKMFCLAPWRVEPIAVIRGTPSITNETRKNFDVSFQLLFWRFR